MTEASPSSSWFVYLLRCADESLYTGITTDPVRRLDEHNGVIRPDKGARYTRSRRPVTLVYLEELTGRADASRREYALKQLTRADKEELVLDSPPPLSP